ncbi:hypothetical protein ACLGL1_09720 [Peptococcus simiae]|uniref:hypothetical protein n=1 Tax=Peptococcus simiae TaxID=1643805 RepID=UPI00398140F4
MTIATMGITFLIEAGCISDFEQQLYSGLVCIGFSNIYFIVCEEFLNNYKLRNQGSSSKSLIRNIFSELKTVRRYSSIEKESSIQSLHEISGVAVQYIESVFLPFIFILMGDAYKNEPKTVILPIVIFVLWVLLRHLNKDGDKNKSNKNRFVSLLLIFVLMIFGWVIKDISYVILSVFIVLPFFISLWKFCRPEDT